MGAAQRWWLHHSLESLGTAISALGGRMILRKGHAVDELGRIAAVTGADEIHALRHYEPWWKDAEAVVAETLNLRLHDGGRLAQPASVRTGAGGRYRMFTPYWRTLKAQMPPPRPLPAPQRIEAPAGNPASDALSDWGLLPVADWSKGFDVWKPGEVGARTALQGFLPLMAGYDHDRD